LQGEIVVRMKVAAVVARKLKGWLSNRYRTACYKGRHLFQDDTKLASMLHEQEEGSSDRDGGLSN
jgi:hypothetical protein